MSIENVEKLRHMWGFFVGLGASDNDLHQLITLAQDMELSRIVSVLEQLIADHRLSNSTRSLLTIIASQLSTKQHRPPPTDPTPGVEEGKCLQCGGRQNEVGLCGVCDY